MAKTRSIISHDGRIGDVIYYTRFGKTFARRRPESINDRQSEGQLRQRALFKTMQQTASLYSKILQRGLTKYAHDNGHTEANEFAELNKQHFVYKDGKVQVNYPALQLSHGTLPPVTFSVCQANGLHVELAFASPFMNAKGRPDDVVHIYAVSPQVKVCELVASAERMLGVSPDDILRPDATNQHMSFNLPDLTSDPDVKDPVTFHLYALVESASTAPIPTLSPNEKKADKRHRNIPRKVSPTTYIGMVMVKY